MSEWYAAGFIFPPKDRPFLCWDGTEISVMHWVKNPNPNEFGEGYEQLGWYKSGTCNCCSGYCSGNIVRWTHLPEAPNAS